MYYETGVSNGAIYSLGGGSGLPWPGLVSVSLSFIDAEQLNMYYEGQAIYNRTLRSRCEATVKSLAFPEEAYEMVGYVRALPGLYFPVSPPEICMFSFMTQTDDGYLHHTLNNCVITQSSESVRTDTNVASVKDFEFKITTQRPGEYSCIRYYTPPPPEIVVIDTSMLLSEDGEFVEQESISPFGGIATSPNLIIL